MTPLNASSAAAKPHVLVTNDDGIDSGFLHVLVRTLLPHFRVTIAAPDGERSWIGRAVTRHSDITLSDRSADFPECVAAYALSGTPTDCVNIALAHLCSKQDQPDAVCSGINIGFNAGLALIHSSGTVAGALEGAFFGLPALAFSQVLDAEQFEMMRLSRGNNIPDDIRASLEHSAVHAARLCAEVIANQPKSATPAPVHNINFPMPTLADTLIEHTRPLPSAMPSLFRPLPDKPNQFTFQYTPVPDTPEVHGSYDIPCLQRGNISYSVKHLDR